MRTVSVFDPLFFVHCISCSIVKFSAHKSHFSQVLEVLDQEVPEEAQCA
jgi:hypothetical protein